MPLKTGNSNIGYNIRELEKPSAHAPKGRPYRQALAIALNTVGVQKRRDGGTVGAVRGATGGRADKISTSVPDGSHIIPADIVSAIGDGNTEAGFRYLNQMFPAKKMSAGGGVPVKLSDGEFSISPIHVKRIGNGDMDRGHRALDHWIVQTRKEDIERRKRLPGPATS